MEKKEGKSKESKDFSNDSDSDGDDISFKSIRNLLSLESEVYFQKYLNEIYDDLLKRESVGNPVKGQKLSFVGFLEYFGKISVFLVRNLFSAFTKGNITQIGKTEFINGFISLYAGNFEQTLKMIFDIYDLEKKGKIRAANMKLILSHLPLLSKGAKDQKKSLQEIDTIISQTFKGNADITYEEFKDAIINRKPDSYLQLLSYYYNYKPFSTYGVNAFKYSKYQLSINIPQTVKKEKEKDNKKTLLNPKFPSVSEDTCFSSFKKFMNRNPCLSPGNPLSFVNRTPSLKAKNMRQTFTSFMMSNSGVKVDTKSSNPNTPNPGLLKRGSAIIPNAAAIRKIPIEKTKSEQRGKSPKNEMKRLGTNTTLGNDTFLTGGSELIEAVVCLFDPKRASSSISMKYYTVMSGKDLIFFNANAKTELKFVMTLNKAFITKGNKQAINATTYYPANIDFSSKYSFILLFDKEFNRDEWVENISTEIGYREIEDYYEIGKNVIGKGGFGEVRTCKSKKTREEYAVKMIDKDKLKRGEYELILSEISIMQLIVHKNIVRLHDTFEDKKFLYVVMDYLQGGDLIELINKRLGNISEQEAAKIIKQIANGINYMHKLGLVHRDLKSENCVFSKKDDYSGLKLIDFGLTRTLARGETLTETLGTLGYAAPEIICRKPYDHKIDVFSIGIISFSILTGHLPFDEKDEKLLIKKLLYSQIDFTTEEFQKRSKGCHKFLDRCLEKNPEIRYSIDDVLNDDWLNVNSA